MLSIVASVDVRIYEKRDKQSVIFKTFEEIAVGETMELINDHDPRPLYEQFMNKVPEHFEWCYLEQGPDLWRIGITKK